MNNKEQFERSELLVGSDAVNKLKNATVAVFGLGGVGGYAVEALARGGVGHLVLVDNDTVSVSNINRQIIATYNTVNEYKTQAWRERIFAINPNCIVDTYNVFITQDNISDFDFAKWNYCIDAVDTVSAKLGIAQAAYKAGTPVISAMGAGNKLSAARFVVTDIYSTSGDTLARVMRRELKKLGLPSLKVVYSTEAATKPQQDCEKEGLRRPTTGSMSYVPGVAGLLLAGEVIRAIAEI